ncbi:DMT family transporter [Nocardia brasiliensis]|uniref:DMT family transporter n=1 Tax=Nocardia brasiliensis TaxID=37326 RepID=UPI00245493CB|nr:EamA family transporter [Nocardia brasiliensis]
MVDYRVVLHGENAVLLSCAAGPCLFGTAFLALELLPPMPLWNATWRILPAGLLLIALHPAMPHGIWWIRVTVLGVLNFGGFFGFQALAAHRLPGGVVATISAAQCVVVPFIVLMFGQRVGLRQFAMPLFGLFGVGLLVMRGDTRLDAVGIAAAGTLALFSSTGMVLTRRWGVPPHTHPLSVVAWQMLAGGLLLLPLAGVLEGSPPHLTYGQLVATAWLALAATALAFALFFGGLFHGVEATMASRLMLLGPVVAVAAGWSFVGERLTLLQLAGIVLVLAVQFGGVEHHGDARQLRIPAGMVSWVHRLRHPYHASGGVSRTT